MYPACQCQRLRLGVVAHRDRDLQAEFSLKARLPRPGAGETQSVPVTRSLFSTSAAAARRPGVAESSRLGSTKTNTP